MSGKDQRRLNSNIVELEKIINAKNFNKEEALEFLEAIISGVDDLCDTIASQREEISDLENKVREAEDEELSEDIKGVETIEYSAPNLMDGLVMESLRYAYEKYTPAQIIEKLK